LLVLIKLGLALTAIGFAVGAAVQDRLCSFRGTAAIDVGRIAVDFKTSDSSYVNGRSAPEGTQPILKSNAQGKTNGRQG
jgi:hypothetical protein